MTDLKSMDLPEIKEYTFSKGFPSYRAQQIFAWLSKGIASFDEMSNLPKELRAVLSADFPKSSAKEVRRQISEDGTAKMLLEFSDGSAVECVRMSYEHGGTVCVSTQVGCAMNCAFCASAIGGVVRNLSAGEMLEQVFAAKRYGPVSNVVLMGSGEPLLNYDNVLRFLHLLNDPQGQNIGMRHISLSTCGIVPGIERLAAERLPIALCISLHAPDNATRDKIMPVNKTYPIESLIPAVVNYYKASQRRIHFEYSLIKGVNDSREHAFALARLASKVDSHINLIYLNPVEERGLMPADEKQMDSFKAWLSVLGANATIRRRLGRDIDAACGQLRRRAGYSEK